MRHLLLLAAATAVVCAAPSASRADGSIVLFPALGRPTLVTVSGQALKTTPEHKASALEKNVRRLAAITWEGAEVEVSFQGQTRQVVAGPSGLFEASFPAPQTAPFPLGPVAVKAACGAKATGEGTVQVIADDAPFLVVSDFDDTVAVTNVQSKRSLLESTLLKDESSVPPVDGMAAFYGCLAKASPAPGFAFVTGSPVEFAPRLGSFLAKHGFPPAALHLRVLGPSTLHGYKEPAIRALLSRFPQKVVLVGDSGEADPEVYTTILKEFPGRVAAVYIHDVGRSADAARFKGMVLFKTGADAARSAAISGLLSRECFDQAFPPAAK